MYSRQPEIPLMKSDIFSIVSIINIYLVSALFVCGFVWAELVSPTDFAQDYTAAMNLLKGMSIYGQDFRDSAKFILSAESLNNYHPPMAAVFHLPFALLTYEQALLLYRIGGMFCYGVGAYLFLRSFSLRRSVAHIVVAVSLLWYPFLENIAIGNVSAWLGGFILIAIVMLKRKLTFWSGLFMAIACGLKLYPLIFIPVLFITRQVRAAIFATICFVVFSLLTGIAIGFDMFTYFIFEAMPENLTNMAGYPVSLSVASNLYGVFISNEYAQALFPFSSEISIHTVSTLCTVVLSAITLSLVWWHRFVAFEYIVAIVIVGMTLATPVAWSHSILVLFPVLAVLAVQAIKDENVLLGKLFVLSFLMLSWPMIPIYRFFYREYFLSQPLPFWFSYMLRLPFIGLLLLLGLITWKMRVETTRSSIAKVSG